MKNIGFLMLHLNDEEPSRKTLDAIDKLIQSDPLNHYTIFASSVDTVIAYNIPVLHIDYAKYFDGDIWCFDIDALQFHKSFKTSRIFFYTSQTPWIQYYNSYNKWKSLLNNEHINIVTSNSMLYEIYEICWKQPVSIMEKLNYEHIKQFL